MKVERDINKSWKLKSGYKSGYRSSGPRKADPEISDGRHPGAKLEAEPAQWSSWSVGKGGGTYKWSRIKMSSNCITAHCNQKTVEKTLKFYYQSNF